MLSAGCHVEVAMRFVRDTISTTHLETGVCITVSTTDTLRLAKKFLIYSSTQTYGIAWPFVACLIRFYSWKRNFDWYLNSRPFVHAVSTREVAHAWWELSGNTDAPYWFTFQRETLWPSSFVQLTDFTKFSATTVTWIYNMRRLHSIYTKEHRCVKLLESRRSNLFFIKFKGYRYQNNKQLKSFRKARWVEAAYRKTFCCA